LLKTSHLKLLDQSNLIKEITASINNQEERSITTKKLQAFLGIADYAQSLANSKPNQYQILNQIIANQQLAIDDQGQALVTNEQQEQYPLRQYLDIQQEFNQQLEEIKTNVNPNTKTIGSLTSLIAGPTLNFIANPWKALKTAGAVLFDLTTLTASSLGSPTISRNIAKPNQATSTNNQVNPTINQPTSTATNNLAKPAPWIRDDKPRDPYRVKVDIEKIRDLQKKFNPQEQQQEFSDDKYVTEESLKKVSFNNPALSLLGNNYQKPPIKIGLPPEDIDGNSLDYPLSEVTPQKKYPDGVNLLFQSTKKRCEEFVNSANIDTSVEGLNQALLEKIAE
jgi:hypothetical protein